MSPKSSPVTLVKTEHLHRSSQTQFAEAGGINGNDDTASPTPTIQREPYYVGDSCERTFIVTLTSIGMILCMIATNIILPVIPILGDEYDLPPAQINLTITAYMIVQGISPALMSALSDLQGRRPAWILALSLYTAANLGLALQHSYVALLALRCLQSIGSSCAIPFGFSVVADISSPAERGRYIGLMQGSVMAAFAFGPFLGGILANRFSWRSIFWFLATSSGTFLVGYVLVIPETARHVVGNGSIPPRKWWMRPVVQVFRHRAHQSGERKDVRRTSFSGVFNAFTILKRKDALILIVYTSLLYFGISAMWATTANHFGKLYNLRTFYLGLSFIPYGVAGGVGSAISGKLIDFNYQRLSRNRERPAGEQKEDRYTDFPFEVARLQIAIPLMLVVGIFFVAYGWVVQKQLILAIPLTFQALIGLCGTPLMGIIYALLIDLFPGQAAATSGAGDLIRCWLGAVSAATVDYILRVMGWGWCFTFIGLITVAFLPLICLVYQYGSQWRQERQMGIQIDGAVLAKDAPEV